jgi:long-chain fatty acid transport protein
MTTFDRTALAYAVCFASLLLVTGRVNAGGFQITEQCTVCQGKRNAGSAASADAPGTLYFNPANLSWLDGTQFDLSLHHIAGTFKFSDRGSTNLDGEPLEGIQRINGAESATIGSLTLTHQFSDRWAAGLNVTVPYGLVTNYNSQWVGRYNADRSDLAIISVSPAVSYRLSEKWALAGGVTWQTAKAELTNNIDMAGVLNRVLADQLPPFLLPEPGNPDRDALARVKADDDGFGYNLGLMWEPRSGTRLGVGYRSKIEMTLKGDLTIKASPGLRDFIESLPIDPGLEEIKVNGKADFDTPNSVWASIYHEIDDRWRLMGSATWTQWTSFDEIAIEIEDDGEIVQPEGWDNQWRFGAGAEFDYNNRLTLRTGLEYDHTPVEPNANTARVPDNDRFWLAFGATWIPRSYERLTLDFAYSHVFINDYTLIEREVFTNQTIHAITGGDNDDANTLFGDYEADADIFSVGFRWRFGGD